jgi:hypothetical protein
MNNQTSILTDIELDAVTGGSIGSAFMKGMAAGASKGTSIDLPPPNFGVGPTTGSGGGGRPCNSNHNGVHYPN